MPTFSFTAPVLGTSDPMGLARFYQRLLGWPLGSGGDEEDPTWVTLRDEGGRQLSFQLEAEHVPPVWPAHAGDQQMQLHLDIEVDDLAAAVGVAVEAGATVAEFQPQDDVRVLLDPAGHPFCLWVRG